MPKYFVVLVATFAASACGTPASPTPTAVSSAGTVAGTIAATASSGLPGGLRLEAASVIEFKYPGASLWSYAPQLRVAETTGVGGINVTGAQFTIPGFDGRPWSCQTGKRVQPGQALDLLPEIYGDFPLTFDENGVRATGDVAVAISFVDDSGRAGTLTASVPIVPGGLPTTYTGGIGNWSCLP